MSLSLEFGLQRGPLQVDIGLEVAAGETVVIVGPNGAGKSTCLKAVAGLLRVDRGHIRLGAEVFDDGPGGTFIAAERRGVGLLFQDHLLFPHMTALENVAFGLRARGLRRGAARDLALEWLQRVGLAARASAPPRELSGGEAQRVALARTLAPEPRVLLLDEPLAAVDVSMRQVLRRELAAHLRTFRGPRLCVTHDAVDAFVLGDRIAVVEAGRVVQTGTPQEIGSQPRSRYIADLIGLNCFRGSVHDGVLELDGGGRLIVACAGRGAALATVHPRAVALFLARPVGSPRNCWQALVVGIEAAPDSMRVRLAGDVAVVAEITAAAVEGLGLRVGSVVWVAIKATEIAVVVG